MSLTNEQHRAFGLHSGIPACCVEEFILCIKNPVELGPPRCWRRGANYRMCNTCYLDDTKEPLLAHSCNAGCFQFLTELGFSQDTIELLIKTRRKQNPEYYKRLYNKLSIGSSAAALGGCGDGVPPPVRPPNLDL